MWNSCETWKWEILCCVLLMPRRLTHLHGGRWSNVISSTRNLKAVVLQNDIHEKQWKTELRLISNDDPEGRAEQLRKSPGERWELLTATEGPRSFFFSLSRSWRRTLMKTLLEILKSTNYRGELWGRRETKVPCASETFPYQFNALHQLFLICPFLDKNVRFCVFVFFFFFYIESRLHRSRLLNPVQVSKRQLNEKLGKDLIV